MSEKFNSKDLALRLLHVEELGESPYLSELDRETTRQVLLSRSGLDHSASDDDLVSWFLAERSDATEADRKRVAMARRIALISGKMVKRLKRFRKD